jgi:hypothetical protein
MVSRKARYRASNGPTEGGFCSIVKSRCVQREEISKIQYPFNKYLPKSLVVATSWVYRLRLGVLFDSIQLSAPEFCKRDLYFATSRPCLCLSFALVFTVATSHVSFLLYPEAGLDCSWQEGRSQKRHPANLGEGCFMPAFVLRCSPTKRYTDLVVINCCFSFRLSLSSEQPSTRVSAPAGEEPAINQELNTRRFSAINASSDFGGAPPIF